MRKIIDIYCGIFEFLIALMLALMVILVFGNVVLRYGFNSGIAISEEVARWLFIWITFLASSTFGALDWMIPAGENGVSMFGRLHVVFGMVWLLGITVHLTLHRQWIISTTKRYLRVKRAGRMITQPGGVKD